MHFFTHTDKVNLKLNFLYRRESILMKFYKGKQKSMMMYQQPHGSSSSSLEAMFVVGVVFLLDYLLQSQFVYESKPFLSTES